ncbi:MAG: outer membrane protein assembly factor BamE [Betaproteobacteria bacterium]|nr:outer membrane protein assembly factor BamE [Betaproteobacteria bacterium]MDH5220668.1 outer membrane protein assembly factor BamE [Betaproteobacteria bacterium]MDH5351350.1 outer membrane protein assembly factor BamE [Betaproteobacteria bacterium]
MTRWTILLAAMLLAGCASTDGRTLQPGKSTAREVSALMGAPGMERKRPNGDTLLYFPRHPWGRKTYVATVGADGVLRGIEQRLTSENIYGIREGMRKDEVEDLLGPPREITRLPRQKRDVWEYPWLHANREKRVLWVQFSDDGVVRETIERHDYVDEPEGAKN